MSNETKTPEQVAAETLERVTRLETRVVQLGDYVGANLRSKQRIDIHPVNAEPGAHLIVEIDSMDVSVSRVLAELRQRGIRQSTVSVWCNDRLIFNLYPEIK